MKSRPILCYLVASAALVPALAVEQDADERSSAPVPIPTPIVYRNTQYGFCFRLPADWKGYTIKTNEWSGWSGPPDTGKMMHGPRLVIRHPAWTDDDPYQDIPIMVLTRAQWREKEEYGLIASPYGVDWGPFGSNARYVFKQPDRWLGYTELKGWREVADLMMSHPFQAPCAKSKTPPAKSGSR